MNDLRKYDEDINEWGVMKDIRNYFEHNMTITKMIGKDDDVNEFRHLSSTISWFTGEYIDNLKVMDIDGIHTLICEDKREILGYSKIAEMTLSGRFGNSLADYMTDLIDNKFEEKYNEPLSEKCKSVLRDKIFNDEIIELDSLIKLNAKSDLFERLRADLLDDEENETTENELSSSYESKNKMKL